MNAMQLSLLPYLEHQSARRPDDFIPVYEPWLGPREEETVLDAVRSGWISSLGRYVSQFEAGFASFCGCDYGVSVANGTVALHLALHALGIGAGDEVIVPALTFIATANAVRYTGAEPVFADVDSLTWTMQPADIDRLVTSRTKAVIPVHLFGHPAPMEAINQVAATHDLRVVEDAAQSHGAAEGKRRTGSLGHIATFSFYANKIITTGEGGMLTTDDEALAMRCRMLRDHAMPPERRYWHEEVGFNYRLTNLQAAVGVAQLARIQEFIARKRAIANRYRNALVDLPGVTLPVETPGYTNVFWMFSILVERPYAATRDELIGRLRERGIDSRPFFHPLDTLPPYRRDYPCPHALALSQKGLSLPSSPLLSDEQVDYIAETLWDLSR